MAPEPELLLLAEAEQEAIGQVAAHVEAWVQSQPGQEQQQEQASALPYGSGSRLDRRQAVRRVYRAFGGQQRCLLRFSRAHPASEDTAASKLTETAVWREEHGVNDITPNDVLSHPLRPHIPLAVAGQAADGRVIVFGHADWWDPDLLAELDASDKLDGTLHSFFIQWAEHTLSLQHSTTALGEVHVMDANMFGSRHLSRKFQAILVPVLKEWQQHYPETLHRAVIVNAPWYVYVVWKVLRLIFNEQTREKIFIESDAAEATIIAATGGLTHVQAVWAARQPAPTTGGRY